MKPFFTPEPAVFFNSPAATKYPGNSIDAIKDAFLKGADVVCLNIQLSKDKIIMAISELIIDNLCETSGAAADFTCGELKEFNAGYSFTDDSGNFPFRNNGMKFLTLEEIFQTFPDKRFNITIMSKDEELVKIYAALVKKYNAADRVLTSTMYGKNIRLVRKLLPESATTFTLSGIIGVYALFKSGLLYFVRRFNADALQIPESIGASYLANGALIEQLHAKGLKVHVWYVKDSVQLKRVCDAGADGFMISDLNMIKGFLDSK